MSWVDADDDLPLLKHQLREIFTYRMKEINTQLMSHHKTVLGRWEFHDGRPPRLSALQEDTVVFITQQFIFTMKCHSIANPVIMRSYSTIF